MAVVILIEVTNANTDDWSVPWVRIADTTNFGR